MDLKSLFFGKKTTKDTITAQKEVVEEITPRSPPRKRMITVQESWGFLVNIIAKVNKFTKNDLNMLHALGKELNELGVKYQHVIEYGVSNIDKTPVRDKAVTEKPSKLTDDKRGRG